VQRAYPWTHLDMSKSQDDKILDSITVAGTQPIPQVGSTAIHDDRHDTTMEATNPNVEGGKALKKNIGQTLATGRPIRNKLGTPGGFRTNRTRIEVTTKLSDAMETKIDRLLTLVEELSNKCRVQEDQITDLKKYVSDARDEIITNQEEVYSCNQFRMTATDAAIREIKVLIETSPQTLAKKSTTVAPHQEQVPSAGIVNNCPAIPDNEERMEGVGCGGLDQRRHAPQLMPGGILADVGETTLTGKPAQAQQNKTVAKPTTKAERNKISPATPRTIDPPRGWWSKVAQGGNFNKSEFTEVGRKGKPIKQPIQSTEKTKVPGPQDTTILTKNRKNNQVKIAAAPTFWKQQPLQKIKCW
jgi:hypothetical protein